MPGSNSSSTKPSHGDPFSVDRVARLAKIKLGPKRREQAQTRLSEVLSFVQKLNELNLDDVEPFFGASNINSIRPDSVAPSSTRDQILSNSPDSDGTFFLVPPVLRPSPE